MKCSTCLAVLVQVSILSMSMLSADKYYVKPDPMNCHGQLCLTVEQVDSYVTTGSTFIFLAGNHTLENGIFLSSVSNVTFRGEDSASFVNILWKDTAIYGDNLTNMTIKGLSFRLNDYEQKIGSAVEIYDSSGIFITDTIFQGSGDRKIKAIFILGTIMKILSCLFEGNTGNYGGAIYASDESEITIINSTFLNNKALSCGGALNAENHTVVIVDGSIFTHNFARASGGALYCEDCVVSIIGSNIFEDNYSDLVSVTSSGGAITVRNSKMFISGKAYFFNNSAVQGGAINIVDSYAELVGREIVFEENIAYYYYGGAVAILISSVIVNTTFIHNSAGSSGGAVYVHGSNYYTNVTISGNFFANDAKTLCGGAVFVENTNVVRFKDIHFERNSNSAICSHGSKLLFVGTTEVLNNSGSLGGALHLSYATVSFSGTTLFAKNKAERNGGAIYALSTNITFRGTVGFTANSAENGGGMYLKTSSSLTLEPNTNITSSFNHASKFGGGIYHEDIVTPSQCQYSKKSEYQELPKCFIQLNIPLSISERPIDDIKLSSYHDIANTDGSFIYGGLLDRCRLYEESNRINSYYSFGKIVPFEIFKNRGVINIPEQDGDMEAITSEPYELCFCDNSSAIDCIGVLRKVVHRGERFTVQLVAITQAGSASTIITAVTSQTSSLKLDQSSQIIPRSCSNLTYNTYSTEDSEELTLYPNGPCRDTGYATAVITIVFRPCPDGFTQSGEQCICEQRLQVYNAKCSIDEHILITVEAGSKFWIGTLYNQNKSYQGLILYGNCPSQYCKTNTIDIALDNLNIQCNFNRIGVLCGACVTNYSLMFGSSRCEQCSNTYLALLLPFAAAGIALVIFLSIFRLTVATGMMNSVVLYANIVQVNKMLFFPDNSISFFSVFIAWLNLDVGFETCFYNGMDAYAQIWLQFAFPIYVWVLISLIIVSSRYSIVLSKLIGHNPIAVLATLLLMSYTKVLKIIIDVYSFAELDYPHNKTVTVWLKDGNVPYLQSWHLLLTVVTSLILVFLFIPYTLLLLLGFKLYRYSGKKYFHWFNRLRPLLDSYYAPYKTHTRYWTGFLLLLRCALYIVFSYNSLGSTNKTFLAIIITFTGIVIIAWLSVKIYKQFHNNVIEASIYINLVILSATSLAQLSTKTTVYLLVGKVFVITIGTIAYHIYLLYVAKSKVWKKIRTTMINITEKLTTAANKKSMGSSPEELSTNASSHDPHKIVSKTMVDLRELLLEQSDGN